MSTGDKKVNIYLKKFLAQQEITNNFQLLQEKLNRDSIKRIYVSGGTFVGGDLSSDTIDTFDISTPLEGYNDAGLETIFNPSLANNISFENATAIDYFVGIKPIEIFTETERNVKTGLIEYRLIEEIIGIKADPDIIIDDTDGTLTIIVDSVTEAGVNNAGRTVRVFLKARQEGGSLGPQTEAQPFEDLAVIWDSSNNKIETTTTLGQILGSISTDPNDYEVVLLGPTVLRNTDFRNDSSIIFLGIITGDNGSSPSVFDQTDRIILPTLVSSSIGIDIVSRFLTLVQGGGTVTHDNTIVGQIDWSADLKIRPLGSADEITITSSSITLANDEVAYIDTSIPFITETLVMQKDLRSNNSHKNANRIWIFHRNGNVINTRGGLQLEQGEKRQLDDIVIGNSIYFSDDDKIRFTESDNIFHFDTDGSTDNANIVIGTTIFYGPSANSDKTVFTEGGTPKWEVLTNNIVRFTVRETGDCTASRDIKGSRDVITQSGINYTKISDGLSITNVDASLNRTSDETLDRDLLKITSNNPVDKAINISSTTITKADSSVFVLRNDDVIFSYGGGTINFATGVITGGGSNFTPIDFTGQASQWAKYSVNLLTDNTILIIPAIGFGATKIAAPNPAFSTGGLTIAIIAVQDDGGAGVGTIENITETNFDIMSSLGGADAGIGGEGFSFEISSYTTLLNSIGYEKLYIDVFSDTGLSTLGGTPIPIHSPSDTSFSGQSGSQISEEVYNDVTTFFRFYLASKFDTAVGVTAEFSIDDAMGGGGSWSPCNLDESTIVSAGFTQLQIRLTWNGTGKIFNFGVLYDFGGIIALKKPRVLKTITLTSDVLIGNPLILPDGMSYTLDVDSLQVYNSVGRLIKGVHFDEVNTRQITPVGNDFLTGDIIVFIEEYGYFDMSIDNLTRLNKEHNMSGNHLFVDTVTSLVYQLTIANGRIVTIEQP